MPLLELEELLTALPSPDVALVTVLELEFMSLGLGDFNGLKVVDELNLLVEDLLLRVVATEELRFCRRRESSMMGT